MKYLCPEIGLSLCNLFQNALQSALSITCKHSVALSCAMGPDPRDPRMDATSIIIQE